MHRMGGINATREGTRCRSRVMHCANQPCAIDTVVYVEEQSKKVRIPSQRSGTRVAASCYTSKMKTINVISTEATMMVRRTTIQPAVTKGRPNIRLPV